MGDENFSDTKGLNWAKTMKPPEPSKEYIPVYKEDKCVVCGKPTHSHKIARFPNPTVWMCHGCFEKRGEKGEDGNSDNTGKDALG